MGKVFSALGRGIDIVRTLLGRLVFVVIILIVLAAVFSGPGSIEVPQRAALVWAPSGVIIEQMNVPTPADVLFGSGLPGNSLLQDLLEALDEAARDARIAALVIDVSELLSVSPAHLETLGDALLRFKTSGKPVYAYGEYFSQAQYALASHADNITLHPMGSLMLTGFGGSQLFFRDLLDKLKVNVHIFRVGEFKSAAEPFTRMDLSPEARADNQSLVDQLWARYLSRVAANRGLPPERLQGYADNYAELLTATRGDMARVAFEQGLIDNIAGIDSFRRQVAAVTDTSNGSFTQIHHLDYLYAAAPARALQAEQIGIIVAQGTIMPGQQPLGLIGADSVIELIQQAQYDPAIKAVVLRVDSPGGSAIASEEIRAALVQLQRAGKPLVVSMAGTAASGGYWISANADQIWASPSTVTGSIGVIGLVPTFERALANIGVGVDGVGTTALSRAGNPLTGLGEDSARIFQASVEDTYRRFLNLVADGRSMTVAQVDEIAGGRVWSGEQALELGLVDALGDLEQALEAAAGLAGLERWQSVYVQRPLSFSEQLLLQMVDSFGGLQVLSSWLPVSAAPGLTGIRATLPILPAAELVRLQSLLDLLMPASGSAQRMRALSVCESCLSLY
jgi:protease IV